MATFTPGVPRDPHANAVSSPTTRPRVTDARSLWEVSQRISHSAVLRGGQEVSNHLASAAKQGNPLAKVAVQRKVRKIHQRALNKAVKDEGLDNAKGSLLKACRQALFQYVDDLIALVERLYQETPGADAGLPALTVLTGLWGGMPQFDVIFNTGDGTEAHADLVVFHEDKIGDRCPQRVVNFKFAPKKMLKGAPLDVAELELACQAVARQWGSIPNLAVLNYLSPRGCTNVLHFPAGDTKSKSDLDHPEELLRKASEFSKPPEPRATSRKEDPAALASANTSSPSKPAEIEVGAPEGGNPHGHEPAGEIDSPGDDEEKDEESQVVLSDKPYMWLGVIIQNPAKPMRQGRGGAPKNAVRVEGWLYAPHCDQAVDGRYFVAQHPTYTPDNPEAAPDAHRRRVLIQFCDYEDYPQNVAHEMQDERIDHHFTRCWFTMVQFLDPDEKGSTQALPIHGSGMDHYKIRNLEPAEYAQVMNLPVAGVPIGFYLPEVGRPWERIPVYFPVGRPEDEQVFFTPTFYVGRPSSGKTNALKAHAAAAINHGGYSGATPPAFIFFDYEGQFADLARQRTEGAGNASLEEAADTAPSDAGDWTSLGLRPIDPAQVTVLSAKDLANPVSFSFEQLLSGTVHDQVNRVKLFLRGMPEATEHVFNVVAEHVLAILPQPRSYAQFRIQFERELTVGSLGIARTLNVAQRNALKAALAGAGTFFDQRGAPFSLRALLQPGKALVFDLGDLPQEKVILYVLACLQRLKFDEKLAVPAVVVIDEAHEVFKKATGSSTDARYLNLIARFLAELASRGRKYHLGLWLASQKPQDLHRDVNGVIVNHYIFGLNPEHRAWLRAAIGSTKAVETALALESGHALFRSAQFRKGQALLLRLPRAPNAHHTFI